MTETTSTPSAPTARQPSIAIVGSGPSGCYLAQFLRKTWRHSDITIYDRLDTPYGLLRYGVAPDHPGTRAVSSQFDRLFQREAVLFVGSTLVSTAPHGGDLTVDELRERYDIVVLATGLHADRTLPGPTAHLSGIHGAGRLTRLVNGHPHEELSGLELGNRIAIIGHGNVAIDLLRLFLTPAEELRTLGVPEDVVGAIAPGPHRDIDIIGRSQPADAKFDVQMIRELGNLTDVDFEAHGIEPETGAPSTRHQAITALTTRPDATTRHRVRFHFGQKPTEFSGTQTVTAITIRPTDGTGPSTTIPTDTVCTAIGFTEHHATPLRRVDHEHPDHLDLEHGILGAGLYCVGWLRRGPRGTIPDARADAKMVAATIISTYTTL